MRNSYSLGICKDSTSKNAVNRGLWLVGFCLGLSNSLNFVEFGVGFISYFIKKCGISCHTERSEVSKIRTAKVKIRGESLNFGKFKGILPFILR